MIPRSFFYEAGVAVMKTRQFRQWLQFWTNLVNDNTLNKSIRVVKWC